MEWTVPMSRPEIFKAEKMRCVLFLLRVLGVHLELSHMFVPRDFEVNPFGAELFFLS